MSPRNQLSRSITVKSALLQATYWMMFCAIYSFASVFLLAKNFENKYIGILIAVANIVAIFSQSFFGSLADRIGGNSIKRFMTGISVGVIVFLGAIQFVSQIPLLVGVLFTFATILALTLQPLVNALVFEYINEGIPVNYGLTRGMGSLSFALISFVLGRLLLVYSADVLLVVCLGLTIVFVLIIQTFPLTSAQQNQKNKSHENERPQAEGTFFHFIRKYKRLLWLLAGLAFLNSFHTIINTFLVQIMKSLGGQESDFGFSLMIAALCELPAMIGFGYLVKKWRSGSLLKFAAVFYVVRGIIFMLATSVIMINSAQLLQAITFALFTPATVYYMNQIMQPEDRVKGQTIMVGATTFGSVIGSMAGGWILDAQGVPLLLLVGTIFSAIGCSLLFFAIGHQKKIETEQ